MNPDEKPSIDIQVPDLSKLKQLAITSELYAGYDFALPRSQDIGNREGLQPEKIIDYSPSGKISKNIIYLEGKWKSNPDNLETAENAKIILDFTASEVNIVAGKVEKELKLEVLINERFISKEQAGADVEFENGKSFVLIKEPRLYNLVDGDYGNYKLTLRAEKGFSFNAFTFG